MRGSSAMICAREAKCPASSSPTRGNWGRGSAVHEDIRKIVGKENLVKSRIFMRIDCCNDRVIAHLLCAHPFLNHIFS